MISPHKLSATRVIANFRLPIVDLTWKTEGLLNRQLEIGNRQYLDGR